MKKIALLLVIAMATTTLLTAADVSVSGWIDSRGGIITKGGDDNKNDDETKLYIGSQEFEVAAAVTGDNFGARIGLIHWSGANGQYESEGVMARPFIHNSYIYVDMIPSTVRLYAGVQMFPFGNYTSYAATDNMSVGGPIAHWSQADAFGFGLGAYNYASNPDYCKKPTGVALELKPVEGLTLLGILDVENFAGNSADTYLLEDVLKNNLHFNAKYEHEMVTIYAGAHLKEDANAMYAEASIKAVENLQSDIKFEYIGAEESDDAKTAISANLGYDLGSVKLASEINQYMQGGDDRANSQTVIGFAVMPTVPVVNLALKGLVSMDDGEDSDLAYTVGTKISKSFGQASTNLEIFYDVLSEDNNAFKIDWKLTCWF